MRLYRLLLITAVGAFATACGTAPPLDISAYDVEPFEYPVPSTPMVEHPPVELVEPVEPIEPPVPQSQPQPVATPAPVAPENTPPTTPPVTPGPAPAPI